MAKFDIYEAVTNRIIDQCEGVEPKYKAEDVKPFDPIEEAEAVCADYISRSGVKLTVKASNEAYYDRLIDGVVVPCREQYDKPAEFYSTLFHELVHSTGHKSRLNRFTGSAVLAGFGSEDYSKEELVAEIGSAAILNRLGIETESSFANSAAYVASWLKALKNDRRLIVSAAGKADKAVELICPTADSKPEQAQEVAPAATPEQQPEQQHKQETTAVKPMKGFKRAEFYSLHKDFKTGEPKLEQHKGYTDGVFFYYRTGKGGEWLCIDPDSGLSIASNPLRDVVKAMAHTAAESGALAKARDSERIKKYTQDFHRLKAAV